MKRKEWNVVLGQGLADRELMLQTREKRTSKMELSGLSEAELLAQQQALFKSATDKYNSADVKEES